MSDIENRIEASRPDKDYAALTFDDDKIARGAHRAHVGKLWEELGQLQLDFLRDQGLQPSHRFLDVGCGSLRAGVKLVEYLDPSHYFGIDINHDVIKAGYQHELDQAGRARLPTANLRATDRFDCDFGVTFDMAIAQSVFTHISLNLIRLCLHRVAKVMRPGGTFFVTFNEFGPNFPIDGTRGGKYTERNVFWYYRRDIKWAASRTPWTLDYIGDWGHPRGQKMFRLTRKRIAAPRPSKPELSSTDRRECPIGPGDNKTHLAMKPGRTKLTGQSRPRLRLAAGGPSEITSDQHGVRRPLPTPDHP